MSAGVWLIASAYVCAAALCLKAAQGLTPQGAFARLEAARMDGAWMACGLVLVLLSLLTVSRLDLVLGDVLRSALRASGWYPLRRPLQVAALLVSLWLGWLALGAALPPGAAGTLVGCVCATALLLLVAWGRLLSWHTLDSLLNLRWMGLSTGRWLEVLGLLGAALCASWQWRVAAAGPLGTAGPLGR